MNTVQADSPAMPQCLGGISEIHITQGNIAGSAEILWSFNNTVQKADPVGIPDPGSGHGGKITVFEFNIPAVPQRIFPFKISLKKFYSGRFLQR